MTRSASEILAAYALMLRWDDIPEKTRENLKTFLLDTIAVGVAGTGAPLAHTVLRSLPGAEPGPACIFGRPGRVPAATAAFVNAYQIHAQEFDCVHEAAVLHPFSATLAAMAAACATLPAVSGACFGAALVAAIDIAVGLGLASRSKLTFFRPAIAGIFGATAGVGRLRGLTQAQMVAAFGHALSFASGTMQAHVEGTPGLALQVGAAASNALLAVELAKNGVPGAQFSIDGPFGYLALFEREHDLAPILGSLGQCFAVDALSHKPYPTGRAAHGGIAAVQRLMRASEVMPHQIAALRYVAPSLIARLVGRRPLQGMSVNYARLCLPYLAARTLLHGTVGLEAFAPDCLADPAVLALAARIELQVDDNPDIAAFTPAALHADLTDGRTIRIDVAVLPGSIAAPLDRRACLDKVANCLTFGGLDLPAEHLAARVAALGDETDMQTLLALASPPAAANRSSP